MSRIPQPSSSHSPTKTTKPFPLNTRARAGSPASPTPTPGLRGQPSLKSLKPTRSAAPSKSPVRRAAQASPVAEDSLSSKPQLSIREQIALKRVEAKKAQSSSSIASRGLDFAGLEDALPTVTKKKQTEDDVDLGRWSVKESIERARSTGVTPEPLKSVPNEPPITTSTTDDVSVSRRRGGNTNGPSWYEAQDLTILKAWSNEIMEIQPEISMFGSLKTIDLHNNKLTSLSDSFADLMSLAVLDLSHNALTSLPTNLFALPCLTTLNLAHNELTSLPFRAPFDAPGSNPSAWTKDSRGDWFSQSITRATSPLPKLTTLDVSYNHLSASGIDHTSDSFPPLLNKIDLSGNPLGMCTFLLQALAHLDRLRELRMEHADIMNDSFPVDALSSLDATTFPALRLLDLGETHVTLPVIEAVFRPPVIKQILDFEVTTEEPSEGTLRIILGKKVVKEAWEVEAERKARWRNARRAEGPVEESLYIGERERNRQVGKTEVVKEAWEIEAEQGLMTEGAKRRARAAAAMAQSSAQSPTPTPTSPRKKTQAVEKEAWEIEAEQGLLTEGAKRRARAAAAANHNTSALSQASPSRSASPTKPGSPPISSGSILSNPRFYDASARTLTLPVLTPPSKNPHARSFSHGSPSWATSKSSPSTGSDLALAVPMPTLPLSTIATQPLAQTLKILVLSNRRKDPSFCIPAQDGVFLPILDELVLENCNLADSIPVSRVESTGDGSDDFSSPRSSEPLLPLIAKLFPSLRTLDLSYNALTSASFTHETLSSLILASSLEPEGDGPNARRGLRHLRLRGNRINELPGFQALAELFRGNRDCPLWKLEELDLRDNEIGKLPPELGLLPLDVFLVDGNLFRVPQRRIWEREGTKGLLSWLRLRIE